MTRQEKISTGVPVKYSSENFWEPLARMRTDFDHLMDEFWDRPMGLGLTRRLQALTGPVLELKDKKNEFELVAEIPGMKADDIELNISHGILRLTGEKREEHEKKEKAFLFSERRYGCFERAIELPRGISHEKISAKLRDGILTVHLPKSPEAIEQERKIPINS
jgi:HSP20 family protein